MPKDRSGQRAAHRALASTIIAGGAETSVIDNITVTPTDSAATQTSDKSDCSEIINIPVRDVTHDNNTVKLVDMSPTCQRGNVTQRRELVQRSADSGGGTVIADRVYDLITDDIYLRLPEWIGEPEIYLKIEGLNPAGSVKLKTAIALIEDSERLGVLTPGGRVVESSSGNLGIALSMVCSVKGYSFTCITDPNASARSVATMRALGAQVVMVTERDERGGYLGSRIACLKTMLALDRDLTWPNQYANAANPRAHSERTATSILTSIRSVDYLFIGAGTTGTLMGCAAYFRQFSPDTRIIAVDACGSVTFGYPAGPRYIPGLGTSRAPDICRPDVLDKVVLVDEVDAVRTCRRIAARYGLLVGGSTGSVLAAVQSLRAEIPSGSRVVAIAPDLGDRYLDTIYNDDWVADRFGSDVPTERELVSATSATGRAS